MLTFFKPSIQFMVMLLRLEISAPQFIMALLHEADMKSPIERTPNILPLRWEKSKILRKRRILASFASERASSQLRLQAFAQRVYCRNLNWAHSGQGLNAPNFVALTKCAYESLRA
jgi:hypothetical protein